MLKKFFLNALSSFVGAWIAIALFGIVAVIACIGLVGALEGSSAKDTSIAKGSVLVIDLQGQLDERETPTDLNYMSLLQGDIKRPQNLASLVSAIAEAKENKNISAIYLKCNGVMAAPATLNALRAALSGFKESGKKIIAYGGNIATGDYYVASVADRIYMNPAGMLLIQGLGGTNLYMKGLFDKLGISFQVVKVGTFKSAVEPFILTEMSAPARAQLDTLYGNMWSVIREGIASERKKLTAAGIDSIVAREYLFTQPASFSLEKGFVDGLVYERCVDSIIAKTIGKDKDDLKFVEPSSLLSQTDWGTAYSSGKKIAVLYATGEIVDGGGSGTINYMDLVPQIVKLAEDDDVRGLVLRVNSPGGAVYGSTQIGEALDYFKTKGKPFAVSMGAYAASGGYWISCTADRIFADPLTITGSIGIFGLIPNGKGLAEKLGVSPQTVSTDPEADFPNLYYPMSETQMAAMQKYVERGYDTFVARVAKGRNMPESKVRVIGEGRVWDAGKALEIGLVDALGSLGDATDWVAKKAGLGDSFDIACYPKIEESIWDLIPELGNMSAMTAMQKALAGDYEYLAVRFAESVLRAKPIQARMPYFKVEFPKAMAF